MWGQVYPGHQCKCQLLLLEGTEEDEEDTEEAGNQGEEEEEEKVEISLHALREVSTGKIIKVDKKAKENNPLILIDSGSTHSFLDEGIAKRLKCSLTGTHLLSITVANR